LLCLHPGTTGAINIMDASSIVFRLCTIFWHGARLPVACVITITHQLILWIALLVVPSIASDTSCQKTQCLYNTKLKEAGNLTCWTCLVQLTENLTFRGQCIILIMKANKMHYFSNLFW
jgi:hypothetical protein